MVMLTRLRPSRCIDDMYSCMAWLVVSGSLRSFSSAITLYMHGD